MRPGSPLYKFGSYLQTPICATTPTRFLYTTRFARYDTFLLCQDMLPARYDTLLASYDTFLARYDTLLAR
jgi:hypothetical protein